MKVVQPYAKLRLWKEIIDWQLLLLVIFAIISLISMRMEDSGYMLKDILINVGCSVVVSISLSIFIYYKYLKRIPDENKNKIEELLNNRLNYETSNHNSVLASLNPNNAHLSREHDNILHSVGKISDIIIRHDANSKASYKLLESDQKILVDSVKNLSVFSTVLQQLKQENYSLNKQNQQLLEENEHLKRANTYDNGFDNAESNEF